MKHQILALAVAALSFTACTNEDNISQDYLADTPIKLNVSVDEPTTRAGYSDAELPEGFGLTVDHYLDPDHNDRDNKYSYQKGRKGQCLYNLFWEIPEVENPYICITSL